MCSRQIIQGRMEYRGSTNGAVLSVRVVVASQMRSQEVRRGAGSLGLVFVADEEVGFEFVESSRCAA